MGLLWLWQFLNPGRDGLPCHVAHEDEVKMGMTITVAKTMTMAMTMAFTIKEITWLTIHNQISRHTSKGPKKIGFCKEFRHKKG